MEGGGERKEKFLSHDQEEEEHVSCRASHRASVNNLKKFKYKRTRAVHAQWCTV